MKRFLAVLAIGAAGVVPFAGAQSSALARPVPHQLCSNAKTPGGTKCLGAGEYCSHKAGYAAAYRNAGFKCKANGRLEEI